MRLLSRMIIWLTVIGGLLVVDSIAAFTSTTPIAEEVTDKEQQALRQLHRNAVEIFVDRPGFGVRRLILNLDDLVNSPKSLAATNVTPQGEVEQPASNADKKPSHYAVKDLLMEKGGRIPTNDSRGAWQLREFHLIGLVTQVKPIVYLADAHPKKRDDPPRGTKDILTRDVNAFEKSALKAFRAGEPLKAEKSGNKMRMVAPIYAGKRCSACHEPGQLLGGFTYKLERVADDSTKDAVRKQR